MLVCRTLADSAEPGVKHIRWNCLGLVVCGAPVAQGRMQSAPVVEPFQVLEDGTLRYFSVWETPSMHEEFGLQGGDKALCHRVVQSGSGPSHRRNDADLFEAL